MRGRGGGYRGRGGRGRGGYRGGAPSQNSNPSTSGSKPTAAVAETDPTPSNNENPRKEPSIRLYLIQAPLAIFRQP